MKKLFTFFVFVLTITAAHSQEKGENLKIDWPVEYQWKVGSNQETKEMHMLELVPKKETVEKWTIIGTMLSYKGVKIPDINLIPNAMFQEAKKNSTEAKLTILEKNEQTPHPWILFKIEAPNFTTDPNPESQLYYAIQGDTSLYTNFVAVKKANLDDDFITKWTKIFKASELVNKE